MYYTQWCTVPSSAHGLVDYLSLFGLQISQSFLVISHSVLYTYRHLRSFGHDSYSKVNKSREMLASQINSFLCTSAKNPMKLIPSCAAEVNRFVRVIPAAAAVVWRNGQWISFWQKLSGLSVCFDLLSYASFIYETTTYTIFKKGVANGRGFRSGEFDRQQPSDWNAEMLTAWPPPVSCLGTNGMPLTDPRNEQCRWFGSGI